MQLRTKEMMVAVTLVGASLWCVAGAVAAIAPQKEKSDPAGRTVTIIGKVILEDGSPAAVRSVAVYDINSRSDSPEFIGYARTGTDGKFRFHTDRTGSLMVVVQALEGRVAARFRVRNGETKDLKLVVPRV